MRKIAQCIQNENINPSASDTIRAIKKVGFTAIFTQWYHRDWLFSQEEQLKLCKELNLEIVFAHLGYDGINNMWLDNKEGDLLTKQHIADLNICHANNIKMVVLHSASGDFPPPPNKLGLDRFQKIVDYAEHLGIQVAFENQRKLVYLDYIFDNIYNRNIGVCYDSGHDHSFSKDSFNWDKYKDKIIAVHLHDNDSSCDQHLLPFDGTIDWHQLAKKLKHAGYNGPITLESCYRNDYSKMSLEEFYKLSYEKSLKLAKIFENA
jgi:sugar phosphate isomerase/epimerase